MKALKDSLLRLFTIIVSIFVVGVVYGEERISVSESIHINPLWSERTPFPIHQGNGLSKWLLDGGLLANLSVLDTQVDVNGVMDLSVTVENRQFIPRSVYFPTHWRDLGGFNTQLRPFKLMIYDEHKNPVCDVMFQGPRYLSSLRWNEDDWRLLRRNEICGVRLLVRLKQGGFKAFEDGFQLAPGVYYIQAVFNKLIDLPLPDDTSNLSKPENWALPKKEDYDYFRSNTVRFVVTEQIAEGQPVSSDVTHADRRADAP